MAIDEIFSAYGGGAGGDFLNSGFGDFGQNTPWYGFDMPNYQGNWTVGLPDIAGQGDFDLNQSIGTSFPDLGQSAAPDWVNLLPSGAGYEKWGGFDLNNALATSYPNFPATPDWASKLEPGFFSKGGKFDKLMEGIGKIGGMLPASGAPASGARAGSGLSYSPSQVHNFNAPGISTPFESPIASSARGAQGFSQFVDMLNRMPQTLYGDRGMKLGSSR